MEIFKMNIEEPTLQDTLTDMKNLFDGFIKEAEEFVDKIKE